MTIVPVERRDRRAEVASERIGPFARAVDEANLPGAALDETVDDCPGSTPCADDDRRSGVGTPAGLMLKDVPREAVDVVVRTPERFIRPHDHAADRADPPRRIIDLVNDRQRTLFVGNGE